MTVGIHELSADQYHADEVNAPAPTLSKSIAHILCTSSPAHAKAQHPKLTPGLVRDEDPKFEIGTVAHQLLLEGIDAVHVVFANDWRTKAAQEERAESRANGRIALLAKHWDSVQAMVASAHEQLAAHHVTPKPFTDGKPEQTLTWQEGDVWCRARLDWLRDDLTHIWDYKSTSASASREAWTRTMLSCGGDLQAWMYVRAVEVTRGVRPHWNFVVQETYPPYALNVFDIDSGLMALGQAKFEYALETWRVCIETGEWPMYPRDVQTLELPAWAAARWLELTAEAA